MQFLKTTEAIGGGLLEASTHPFAVAQAHLKAQETAWDVGARYPVGSGGWCNSCGSWVSSGVLSNTEKYRYGGGSDCDNLDLANSAAVD